MFYPEEGPPTFKGSTGWLTRFNTRHGIKNVQLRGEFLASKLIAVEPFCKELAEILSKEGYS